MDNNNEQKNPIEPEAAPEVHNSDLKESKDRKSFGSCMICLEELYKDEHRMFLPCSHHFHDPCIRPWLKTNTVCPICMVSVYVRVDEKDPGNIPEHFKNPEDSRTMSEVLRERQEQSDILASIQGHAPRGMGHLIGGLAGRMMGGNQADQLLSMMMLEMLAGGEPGGPPGWTIIAPVSGPQLQSLQNLTNIISGIPNADIDEDDLPPLEDPDSEPEGDGELPPLIPMAPVEPDSEPEGDGELPPPESVMEEVE